MFILSLLTFFYGFLCLLTILLVLIQKGKGNMGLGNTGGSNQAIFGSSGGQDTFQKITWTFLTLLLAGSLTLAIAKAKYGTKKYRSSQSQQMPTSQDFSDEF